MPFPLRNPKLVGEEAECAFQWQAIRHGLVVAKPYGDSAPYDFIVDSGPYSGKPSRLLRVQLRSASTQRRGFYFISVRAARCQRLTRRFADFLVAFIPPFDAWYIIPVTALGTKSWAIALRPHRTSRSQWERYRGAWHRLGGRPVLELEMGMLVEKPQIERRGGTATLGT